MRDNDAIYAYIHEYKMHIYIWVFIYIIWVLLSFRSLSCLLIDSLSFSIFPSAMNLVFPFAAMSVVSSVQTTSHKAPNSSRRHARARTREVYPTADLLPHLPSLTSPPTLSRMGYDDDHNNDDDDDDDVVVNLNETWLQFVLLV